MARHKPGQVRDAIIDYLKRTRGDASVETIRSAVSRSIGDVPASSVRSYLRLNTPGLFKRTGRGRYTIASQK